MKIKMIMENKEEPKESAEWMKEKNSSGAILKSKWM